MPLDNFIASKADSEIQLKHAHDFVSIVETYIDNKLNLYSSPNRLEAE